MEGLCVSHAAFHVACLDPEIFWRFTLAYVPFGPLEDVDLANLSRQLSPLLDGHLFAVRYDLPYGSAADGNGLIVQRESVQPDATVIIDLTPGYEVVRSRYRQRARRALRRSEGKVTVSLWDGDEKTFEKWYGVYEETGRRDGFSLRPRTYIRDVLSLGDGRTGSKLFVALRDGNVVGERFSFPTKRNPGICSVRPTECRIAPRATPFRTQ